MGVWSDEPGRLVYRRVHPLQADSALLVRPIIKMLGKVPLVKQVNQLLGGVFGLVNTGIWLIVFSIILMSPFFENGQQVIEATPLSMPGKAAAVINENCWKCRRMKIS